MSIPKPYYRICRPWTIGDVRLPDYPKDGRYAPDRVNLTRAFELLEEGLTKVFEFVEPVQANEATYSHQIYQLLLRACTEVETICNAVLEANGYTKKGNWNVTDYSKIEGACKLSEYEVKPVFWQSDLSPLRPFNQWATCVSLPWYQAYNNVKHNRHNQFQHANLKNVVEAIAGVFILLFAQFNKHSFDAFHGIGFTQEDESWIYHSRCLFGIKPPKWDEDDCYDHKWLDTWENEPKPFAQYPFG